MERILEVVNGNYRETMKWIINGETHIRRTNNKNRICEDMRSLTEPICCYIDKGRGRIEIHYEDTVLTLTNYRKNIKKYLLFREKVTEVIDQKIPVSMKENLIDRMQEVLADFKASGKTFDGSKITALFAKASKDLPKKAKLFAMDMASITAVHIDKARYALMDAKMDVVDPLIDKVYEKWPEWKAKIRKINKSKIKSLISEKFENFKLVKEKFIKNINIVKDSMVSNVGKRLTVEENASMKETWKEKAIQKISSLGVKIQNINMPKISSIFLKKKNGYKLAPFLLAGVLTITATAATPNTQEVTVEPVPTKRAEITIQKQETKGEKLGETLSIPKPQVIEILDMSRAKIEEEPVEPEIVLETSLEQRLENVKQIQEGVLANSSILPVGTKLTPYALNRLIKFINSSGGQYAQKYGEQFGVDPYLLTCICMQESSLTPTSTNGYAYGYYQVELGAGLAGERTVQAMNVLTGQKETLTMNLEKAQNPELNTKFGAMMLQNCLRKFNNNIYLALQSYTFGEGAVNLVVSKYADRKGITREEVMANYSDLGYIEDFQQIHDDPHGYVTEEDLVKYKGIHTNAMNYLRNWPYKTYGDPKYIEHVLAYYIGTTCQIKTVDTTTTVSLVTNQAQQTPNVESAKLIG